MPTKEEINELIAFLPRLATEGFSPVKEWKGGERTESGSITMPWPDYEQVVLDFFQAASARCWMDGRYLQSEAVDRIGDEDFVGNASLDEIRSMLTWCVRGERFCDGHWANVIEAGQIRRLLERLVQLRAEMDQE